jgi:hypothetical protein
MIWALVIFLGTQPQTAAVGFHTRAECEAAEARVRPRLLAVSTPVERRQLRFACYPALPLAHGDPRST